MTESFFSPGSVIWRVDREMALLLAGGRALLMQIAHPKVGAGVAEHSHFQKDPLRRLRHTMNTMWSVVFDDAEQARQSLQRVKEIHRTVQGRMAESEGKLAGLPYSALDPQLLLWVHATLVDSALLAYEKFVAPLPLADKLQYYEETKRLATLFDVPPGDIPPSLDHFRAYMEQMLNGPEICVTATVRLLARDILHPQPLLLRPSAPLFSFITTGLLPASLREAYHLPWDEQKEKWLHRLALLIKTLLPCVPPVLRFAPHARAARRRLKRMRP